MDKGVFEPAHSAHAIEQCVLALQFDRPLEQAQVPAIANEGQERFKAKLPGGGIIQSFPGFPMVASPMAAPIGFLMQRSAPDGSIEKEFKIEPTVISFRTSKYSRWSDVWSEAKDYFSWGVEKYVGCDANLLGISVNFVDKFVWNGKVEDFSLSKLLTPDSEYLPNHIFNKKDLWHVHTGSFLKHDAKTKRLLNLNIDCLDEPTPAGDRRVVMLATVLNDMLNQPGFEQVIVSGVDIMEFISEHIESLHSFDKEILKKVLTESMSKRIALTD